MSAIDPRAVARAPAQSFSAVGYRNQAREFDNPLSGEGARRFGGRFNPPQSFPVIYLCTTRECAAAELTRQASRQGLAPADLLPRELWQIVGELTKVLDLTEDATLNMIGIAREDLIREEFSLTRQIGEAAYEHQFQAILSPSATGVDQVLAIFTENLAGAVLYPKLVGEWNEPHHLPI